MKEAELNVEQRLRPMLEGLFFVFLLSDRMLPKMML